MTPPTKRLTILTAILGMWLFSSPILAGAPALDRWNDLVSGAVIATLSGYSYATDHVASGPHKGGSVGLVLVGTWLLFAPFVSGVTGPLRWNDVVVGVLVTAFALYNLFVASLIDPRAIQNDTDDS